MYLDYAVYIVMWRDGINWTDREYFQQLCGYVTPDVGNHWIDIPSNWTIITQFELTEATHSDIVHE